MNDSAAIDLRARFDFIRYANCWEDPQLLLGALPPGARCLSIASAGDNSFSLLAGGASSVTAFDINPAQLALCELKKAAFATLSHEAFLRFLGFLPAQGDERLALYRNRIRPLLPEFVAASFDANPGVVAAGVVDGGKFESYFRLFRRRILPLAHSRRECAELLNRKSDGERRRFFYKTWANLRYRLLFKIFFSRFVMGRLGRDPEFFRYVKTSSISKDIWKRAERAMTELPTNDNPYLRYIISGSFLPTLPHYARPEHFEAIRSRLDRIRFVRASPGDLGREGDGFAFFNLSDIFEYMGRELFADTARTLLALAAPGAVFAYFNMMLPRDLADALPESFLPDSNLAGDLFSRNQAFFYGAFHVDRVRT